MRWAILDTAVYIQNDALIAPTARHRGATVVTRNRGDFELLERKLHLSLLLL